MNKKIITCVILLGILILFGGCASVKEEIKNINEGFTKGLIEAKKEFRSAWAQIKGEKIETNDGSREEAVLKYDYRGQRNEIITETPTIIPMVVRAGETVSYKFQYTILSPQSDVLIPISEVTILSGDGFTLQLNSKMTSKRQGIYTSSLLLTIPKDVEVGRYRIISTITSGVLKEIVQGEFTVEK